MAIERLKFRCYRCSQLLAVAASRAGTVVACPKCSAELLIPRAEPPIKDDAEPAATAESQPRTRRSATGPGASPQSPRKTPEVPSFLEGIAGMIPAEVAELRPEDLRVEAEFFQTLTRSSAGEAATEPVSSPEPDSLKLFPAVESEGAPAAWPTAEEISSAFASSETSEVPETVDIVPKPAEFAPPPPVQRSPDAPPIEVETPTLLAARPELRHVREVVVPASVVLLWSLFGLAGLALSFIAGLMIGHFLWKMP
jgi:hypothetical protein